MMPKRVLVDSRGESIDRLPVTEPGDGTVGKRDAKDVPAFEFLDNSHALRVATA